MLLYSFLSLFYLLLFKRFSDRYLCLLFLCDNELLAWIGAFEYLKDRVLGDLDHFGERLVLIVEAEDQVIRRGTLVPVVGND